MPKVTFTLEPYDPLLPYITADLGYTLLAPLFMQKIANKPD